MKMRDANGRFVSGFSGNPSGRPPKHQEKSEFLKQREYKMREKYGIGLAEYYELFDLQSGVCAICGKEETKVQFGRRYRLAIDHNHETGGVRGLLCYACNTGIGKLGDDPEMLRRAADYLEGVTI